MFARRKWLVPAVFALAGGALTGLTVAATTGETGGDSSARTVGVAGVQTPAADSAGRAAALRIASGSPLTLRGAGFEPDERVRIYVALAKKRATRTVRAGGRGQFLVAFARMHIGRCGGGLVVRARGSQGSTASLELEQLHCQPVDSVRE